MKSLIQKYLISHYLLTGALLAVLAFYSYRLHQYSKYDKELVSTIQLLQDGGKPGYDSDFKSNLEKQFTHATTAETGWLNAFKNDSAGYPQNIITYSFRNMPKFGLVMEKMTVSADTLTCILRVRDKEPFNVAAKFVKQGNIYLLDNLENIPPLYKRLNGYHLYLRTGAKTQTSE